MRKWQTTGLVILVVLAVLLVQGLVLGTGKAEQKEHVESTGIRRITVVDMNTPVEVLPSQEGAVRLEYMETRFVRYEIARDGDHLTVRAVNTRKWYDLAFRREPSRLLRLYIPSELASLSLGTSNAQIDLKTPLQAGEFSLASSNGRLRADAGSLHVMGNAVLTTSNAGIDLANAQFDADLFVRSSNGELTLKDIDVQYGELRTSNGAIHLDGVEAQKGLTAETSNGKIVAEALSTQDGALALHTSNANVTGTIQGPIGRFAITSRTSNGDNSLPAKQDGGPASLAVETSNGKIDVRFE